MMRREMRARRRLGANSRSTDVVVTPWADEYVPAPCADLPTYPPCHAGAGGRTYLPTPPLITGRCLLFQTVIFREPWTVHTSI